MNRDTYATPKEVFAVFNAEFNFAVDVAASSENALCDIYYTEDTNALNSDWRDALWPGCYAWCNPPYSDIGPWVAKAAEQSAKGIGTVMLVMMDQSVGWYREAIKTCQEVRLVIGGRLSFLNPSTGKPAAGNNKGSMFIIWHPFGRTPVQYSHIERDEMLAAGRALLEQSQAVELSGNSGELPTSPCCPGCGKNCDHVELAGFRTFCQPCFDKLPPFPKDGRSYNPEQQSDGNWLWVTNEPEPQQQHNWPVEVKGIVEAALQQYPCEPTDAFYNQLCDEANRQLLKDGFDKESIIADLVNNMLKDEKICAA